MFFKRVRDTDYEYAAHLAAMVWGRAMIENKPIAVADDLSIDAEYWQWATVAKPAKTLCFSSSAAYPIKYQREDDYVLLQEEHHRLWRRYRHARYVLWLGQTHL